uniref:Deubiquitinating enzyme MINDY-3/4 conserved domain-containing protein n=3 Tax=Hemiselmis andersenii TaxID=464988 RepID=A0A6U4VFS2_HEMAN|mmetsp:Transcript_33302/g.77968  ORF Transcript_33302/g.77968 Transcript_33302/m.77968 type:complete len:366 (+) Transcript_33302:2-1099(+)
MKGGSWIGIQGAADLKAMVFGEGGARSTFNSAWMQGFFQSPHSGLEYGLVQVAGGPCGVLASVQAYMVRHMLFVENRMDIAGINEATFNRALLHALADILWQAGGDKSAKVAVKGSHSMTGEDQDLMRSLKYKPDGLTEMLSVVVCSSRAEVLDALAAHQGVLTERAGPGVPLVLYSVMLSRGLHNIRGDVGTMDGLPRLMGQHDYCSQEMVNLFLVGRAVANAFDGDKDLDGMKLTGVHKRSNVGMLTLFEHYDSMQVGSRLKDPITPVWVVCSESHFSVIFSCDAEEVQSATASGGGFDLHYYDELAKQDEPIRLSVSYDLSKASDPKVILDHSKDMTPPLEHCIRTKWAHCHVSWNGTDPIL